VAASDLNLTSEKQLDYIDSEEFEFDYLLGDSESSDLFDQIVLNSKEFDANSLEFLTKYNEVINEDRDSLITLGSRSLNFNDMIDDFLPLAVEVFEGLIEFKVNVDESGEFSLLDFNVGLDGSTESQLNDDQLSVKVNLSYFDEVNR